MSFIRENKNYLILSIAFLLLGTVLLEMPSLSLKKWGVILLAYVCLLVSIIIIKPYVLKNTLGENLFYFFIVSAFFGPAILNINIGPFSIFPFRIIFPIVALMLFYKYANKSINTWNKIKIKPLVLYFLFWLSYAFLSTVWIRSLSRGIVDFIFLSMGIGVILFMVLFITKRKQLQYIYYLWVLSFVLILGLGLVNHFLRIHLPISRIYSANPYYNYIPTSVFVNENDFASFISISIFFVFSGILYFKNIWVRLAGVAIILASFYLIDITSSRANILAALLAFIIWFLFLTTTRKKIQVLFYGSFVSGLGMLILNNKVESIINAVGQLISSLTTTSGSDTTSTSTDIRVNLLKNSIVFFENTFGFGVGTGNAVYYMKDYAVYPTANIVNIHNWWVEILVNYGLVVFILYCLVYVYLIKELYFINRRISDESSMKVISIALFLAMIVFPLASISPSSQIALNYFWVLYGFVLAFINYMKVELQEEKV